MLDMRLIREEPERVREALVKRQMDPSSVDEILVLDERRRQLILNVEEMRAERNAVSKEIGGMKEADSRQAKINEMRLLGERIAAVDAELKQVETGLQALVSEIPNIPDPDVPVGVDDSDNIVLRQVE